MFEGGYSRRFVRQGSWSEFGRKYIRAGLAKLYSDTREGDDAATVTMCFARKCRKATAYKHILEPLSPTTPQPHFQNSHIHHLPYRSPRWSTRQPRRMLRLKSGVESPYGYLYSYMTPPVDDAALALVGTNRRKSTRERNSEILPRYKCKRRTVVGVEEKSLFSDPVS